MNPKQKHLPVKTANMNVDGYRTEFIRRKMLQKSFKGNEKGYKALQKLSDNIHTGMEVLWRQNLLCDVELISSDKRRFKAHKLVLSTCCDYFYEYFIEKQSSSTEYAVVDVEDISGSILDILLEAIYTGKVKIEAGNVDDVLSSAASVGMYTIIEACEDFLLEHASKDNCLQLLSTAFKFNLNRLTDSALEIAAQNFQTVSKRQLFRNLPVAHLVSLLKRNDLEVESELDVFTRVRTWIEENRQSRLQHAAELIGTVRLPLMNPAEVIDKIECCGYLMDIAACQKMVKECLHYHLMPARQCLLQSPRTVPRLKESVCLVTIGGAPRFETEPICDDVMKFKSETNQWELLTKLPAPRQHHAVTVLNGFLYVAGGEEVNGAVAPCKQMFRFDPRNGNWMETASMSTPRQSFQLCVLHSTIYAVGGRVSKDACLASVERYDPSTDRWEDVAQLSSPRRCAALASLHGKLYAVGGCGNKVLLSRVERYTPSDNRWELLKSISTPRFFGHLLQISGDLYLIGGAAIDEHGNVMCVEEIERYSPSNNHWTCITKMRTPRSEFGCAAIKQKIFIVGGYNWNTCNRPIEIECFDTETLAWSTLPSQKQPLVGVAAAVLTVFEKGLHQQNKS